MTDAFISYSRTDSAFADKLLRDLEARGIPVWIDRDNIEGGAAWRAAISMAIRSCCAFILILSPRSTESEQVSKELSVAETHDRLIVPVMIESCEIPPGMELALAELQWINFAEQPYEAALERLTRVIKETRSRAQAASTIEVPSASREGSAPGTVPFASGGGLARRSTDRAPSAPSSPGNRKWLLVGGVAVLVAGASFGAFQFAQDRGANAPIQNATYTETKPAPAQLTPVVAAGPAVTAPSAPASGPIVGNSRTLLYHFPNCPGYARVSPQARTDFANAREAERAGYKLSDNCSDPAGSRPAAAIIANSRTRDYFLPHCNGYTATRPEYRVPFGSTTEAEQAGYRRSDKCS